jgi:hypothetical protein
MATNDYHFNTHWRVEAAIEEVAEILSNGVDLVRWWPSVYLNAEELEPGDAEGVGRVISLYPKGWLPYTLRWQFRVTESRFPHGFTLEAWGDFDRRGIWTLEQDGPWVDVTYDWKIRAEKPLLRYFSLIMKPIFGANHRWAMAQGEASLKLELARRHAATAEERAQVPAPPGPTSVAPGALLVALAAMIAGAGWAWRRAQAARE